MKFLMLSILSLSLTTLASHELFAKSNLGTKISVEQKGTIKQWMNELQQQSQNFKEPTTECREVDELPGAILCLSDTKNTMNAALVRASIYAEGRGDTKNKIAPTTSPAYLSAFHGIGGHDLQSKDLDGYYQALANECKEKKTPEFCMTDAEKEFKESIIDKIVHDRKGGNFVLITFAVRNNLSAKEVVTHEIMHAQYFLDSRYRKVCDDYWKNLNEDSRHALKASLSRYYDTKDEVLMSNEFQAYMLMTDAKLNLLGSYVDAHSQKIKDLLSRENVKPIAPIVEE